LTGKSLICPAGPDGRQPDPDRVMPGLVPGIHVLLLAPGEDVDGRDKPGHEDDAKTVS
jgi:hypothetical protein